MPTYTRLYDEPDQARAAVAELEAAGIPRDDISIVMRNPDGSTRTIDGADEGGDGGATGAGAAMGGAVGGGAGLLAGLGMLAIPGVGPVVAAGWLAATLTGAAAGAIAGGAAGGLVDALTDSGVDREDAHVYAEGIRRGSALVTVRTDAERASLVMAALDRQPAVNLEERRRQYRDQGWTMFDDTLEPPSHGNPRDLATRADPFR